MLRYACLLLVACTIEGAGDSIEPQVTSRVVHREFPVSGIAKLDVLFVVDNSPAMAAYRPTIAARFRELGTALETFAGGVPDVHVGVITTDVGTRGANDGASTTPAIGIGDGRCSPNGNGGELITAAGSSPFLADEVQRDGTRQRNYSGSIADAIANLADVGASGCAYARPLEALRRSVEHPANLGFLREDAFLAVVFVSSQDDCSFADSGFLGGVIDPFRCTDGRDALVAIDEYATLLKSLKSGPGKVAVLGLLGPPTPFVIDEANRVVQPSCARDQMTARPAVRLHALFEQFPDRAATTAICDPDWSPALALLAQLPRMHLGAPCIDVRLADVDPVTPGTQHGCAVWYRHGSGVADEASIASCANAPPGTSCWLFEREPTICPSAANEIFRLRNPYASPHGSVVALECVSENPRFD